MNILRRFSPASLFLLLILTFSLPASAGVGVWTPLGPDGGSVYSLAVDPADPEIVYAGTALGLFKTTDGGQAWSLIRSERGGASVFALVGDTLYVHFLSTGLLQSNDGGLTWTAASNLPRGVFALAADPRAPNRLWAAGRTVHLSDDGGATWQSRSKPRGIGKRPQALTALAVDPAGPWIYVTLVNGFFRSADLGKTWQRGEGISGRRRVGQLAVDAANPSVLYAATDTEVFRSLDRGAHWQRIGAATLKGSIQDVLGVGDRVYVAVFGAGIFYSSDQGATWTRGAQSPADPEGLAAGPGVVYAATHAIGEPGGPYRSLDRGVTWERASAGILSVSVLAVAVDPSDQDVLYAGTDLSGLLRSADRGATWEAVDLGIEGGKALGIPQVLVEPAQPSTVYATSTEIRFFRSGNGGETWQRLQPPRGLYSIALDLRQPGALWGVGGGLFHSDDRGEHWTQVKVPGQAGLALFEVQVDPRDPRIVYVAGYHWSDLRLRLLRSADAGQSWQRRDAGIGGNQILGLALDPAAPATLYAGTDTALFRSTDAGKTWARLPGIGEQVDEVVAAPTTPTAIYAAVSGSGVLRSIDGGQSWTPTGSGLDGVSVVDLRIDPQDPGRLYAGAWTRGVFTYEEPPGND